MCREIVTNEEQTEHNDEDQEDPTSTETVARTNITLVTITLDDNDIILDNASGPNIFRNGSLLSNIKPCNDLRLGGVNAKGTDLTLNRVGSYGPFKNVYLHPDASANILSLAQASDLFTVTLSNDTFYVDTGNKVYTFKRQGSFYIYRHIDEHSLFSKRQFDSAMEAKVIQARLGFPSANELYNTVKMGGINNIPITSTDVLRMKTLPKSLAEIKGKMTSPSPTPLPVDWFKGRDSMKNGTLSIDLMSVNGQMFLIGIIEEISMTFGYALTSKRVKAIQAALKLFVSNASANNWILVCRTDGEPAIKSMIETFKLNMQADISGTNRHIPIIERRIRVIKERVRGQINTLPYTLPHFLLKYLIYFVISRMNLLSTTSSINEYGNRPPYELFFDRKIDYKRDIKVGFGEYAQIYAHNSPQNSMAPRSRAAISLYPSGNSSGSVKFFCISTKSIVSSDKWTTLPINEDVIKTMNGIAHKSPILSPREEAPENEGDDELSTAPNVATHTPTEANTRYNLRTKKPVDYTSYHITVKQALHSYRNEAIEAIKKELQNTIAYKVWTPFKIMNIPKKARILPSSAFLKEKYFANGTFDKLKARLVGGGHRQDRSIYEKSEIESPTADIASVILLAAIGCQKNYQRATADVTSAYLNAPIGSHQVFIRLDPVISGILIALDPLYLPFMNADGTLTVRLDKALYGCLESAKLWYTHVATTLLAIPNMKRSSIDPCIFYLIDGTEQIFISIYVDDFFIVHNSDRLFSILSATLKHAYDISFTSGNLHNYLGMLFEYSNESVSITMPKYIDDILRENAITTHAPTPASNDLFTIDATSPPLTNKDKLAFHTTTAKLLYLSKRTRPDIQLAIAFLTTRVQHPTAQDKQKLHRTLAYLNSTKSLPLRLAGPGNFQLNIFIDASYATHHDMKSHSGSIVSLNGSTITSTSKKQRLNTKSSCEAELVAVSDCIYDVLRLKYLLEEMGFSVPPPVLEQDNKSTITLLECGRPASAQSKHIAIRFFFASDLLIRKEITMKYCETNKMTSDILNKPIQGLHFIQLRNDLLGLTSN